MSDNFRLLNSTNFSAGIRQLEKNACCIGNGAIRLHICQFDAENYVM